MVCNILNPTNFKQPTNIYVRLDIVMIEKSGRVFFMLNWINKKIIHIVNIRKVRGQIYRFRFIVGSHHLQVLQMPFALLV